MPILMLALIALAAFGIIGFMLALATSLEHKKSSKHGAEPKRAA